MGLSLDLTPAVLLNPAASTRNVLQATADSVIPIRIQQHSASQSANMLTFEKSDGTLLSSLDFTGGILTIGNGVDTVVPELVLNGSALGGVVFQIAGVLKWGVLANASLWEVRDLVNLRNQCVLTAGTAGNAFSTFLDRLQVKAAASQTNNLLELQNSSAANIAYCDASGNVHIVGGTLKAGATTLNSLTVSGTTNLLGALTAGASTFNSVVTTGNTNVLGSLVAGSTTLNTLTVTGTTTLSGNLTSAGVFLGPNGSASAPTYSFQGANNSGLYFDGASSVLIARSGRSTFQFYDDGLDGSKILQVGSSTHGVISEVSLLSSSTTGASTLVLQGSQNAIETIQGGVARWYFYDASSSVWYFRDLVNARMQAYFVPGSAGNAYTFFQDQLVVQAAASQTANLQDWQNSSAANISVVDASGKIAINSTTANSWLQVGGPISTAYSTKTQSYTLGPNDSVIGANAAASGLTMTLPTAVGITGRMYTIKKIDSSANNVTVATTSSQTIDGATTAVIVQQYESISLVSDGANWIIV